MPKRAELQHEADLCRRAASVPTSGGYRADRVLLALADDLERQVAEIEDRSNRAAETRVTK